MVIGDYNIVVVGAGPAGIAAAVRSSRSGFRTLLIEKSTALGGIAVMGNITTICGLYQQEKASPQFLYEGFPHEFALKIMAYDSVTGPMRMGRVYVLPYRPETFHKVSSEFLESRKNIEVVYNAVVTGIHMENARIQHMDINAGGAHKRVKADVVIDCTGDATICSMSGLSVLPSDEINQVPAVVFMLDNTGDTFSSQTKIMQILVRIKRAVDAGELPPGADAVDFTPVIGQHSVSVKLNLGIFLKPEKPTNEKELEQKANALKEALFEYLIHNYEISSDTGSHPQTSTVLHRSGKRAKGMYILTREDVLTNARFKDAVTRGCWPIEKWHFSKGRTLEYLSEGGYYDIPERSLRPQGIENLLAAGKCISADNDAIASARVIGCCLATGESAGNLARRIV